MVQVAFLCGLLLSFQTVALRMPATTALQRRHASTVPTTTNYRIVCRRTTLAMHAIFQKKAIVVTAPPLLTVSSVVSALRSTLPFLQVLAPVVLLLAVLARLVPLVVAFVVSKFSTAKVTTPLPSSSSSSSSSSSPSSAAVLVPKAVSTTPTTTTAPAVDGTIARRKTEQILEEQAACQAAVKASKIAAAAADDAAKAMREREEVEVRKREEEARQAARLEVWKQQRAAEKAALGVVNADVAIATASKKLFEIDGAMSPEKEKEVVGAAAVTAALLGFKMAGPIGSFVAATLANYLSKKKTTQPIVTGTGKAALGAVSFLSSFEDKFAVVKNVEAALLEGLKGNAKSGAALGESYVQTKSALERSVPRGKDVLNGAVDVTDAFLKKVEEIIPQMKLRDDEEDEDV